MTQWRFIVGSQLLNIAGEALGSQPTLSRWENASCARDLVHLNDALLDQFIRLCGKQVRQRGEILLDIDSTDDPTHGQQQLSIFNGAYGQHMDHPMLIFERHTGCLLAARLRPGNASSHARIVPMLLRLVPRLEAAFPGVPIKLRGDAGFALPLLYQFCEFFGLQYALGIPAHSVFQRRAAPLQKRLARHYRRTGVPQRSFSSFRHRAGSWSHQRRICYKAEHTATGTNLRFLITNCPGRASEVFAFYNDRGECENRIEEFKKRLPRRPAQLPSFSGQRLSASPARLRLQSGQSVSSAATSAAVALGANRNSTCTPVQNRRSRAPDRPVHPRPPGHRLAVAIFIRRTRFEL